MKTQWCLTKITSEKHFCFPFRFLEITRQNFEHFKYQTYFNPVHLCEHLPAGLVGNIHTKCILINTAAKCIKIYFAISIVNNGIQSVEFCKYPFQDSAYFSLNLSLTFARNYAFSRANVLASGKVRMCGTFTMYLFGTHAVHTLRIPCVYAVPLRYIHSTCIKTVYGTYLVHTRTNRWIILNSFGLKFGFFFRIQHA
jgi:hypothetical protein